MVVGTALELAQEQAVAWGFLKEPNLGRVWALGKGRGMGQDLAQKLGIAMVQRSELGWEVVTEGRWDFRWEPKWGVAWVATRASQKVGA